MAKKKNNDLTCPECKGLGFITEEAGPRRSWSSTEDCFNCLGTGISDDSDSFEHIYRNGEWS